MDAYYHLSVQRVAKRDNSNSQGTKYKSNCTVLLSLDTITILIYFIPNDYCVFLHRGVGVDDQGFICVADSGNNRVQIFHPDGSFLRAFGSWGSGDAEFKGLEGVAIMSNGNILVCDRENHRVQVF